MKRLLLINPKFPESFWSFKWTLQNILPHFKAVNPPLGLATLAALCPPDWEVEIVDENIESIPLNPQADVVGICGMEVQYGRQKELLRYYRDLGRYVVAGGSFASLCPEKYTNLADTVVAGEAEYIWKQFCRDYEATHPQPLYKEIGTVDMKDSPAPRFDLLKIDQYMTVNMQFSRGCPFQCEFCDIIVMFGRNPRVKTVEQIGKELDLLRAREVHNLFFVDDNLIGNKPAAKALLTFLIQYQKNHDYKFRFGTEASLNLAQDTELLELFSQAGFEWVFMGIESSDKESLKETKKLQNTHEDLLVSIRRIYSYGIDVFSGFIIGFDHDKKSTFETQYRFIVESGIQVAMAGLLIALPKTPLYLRLEKEGRLSSVGHEGENTKLGTNIIPKNMTYDEMVLGYRELYRNLLEPKNIAQRIRNKLTYMKRPCYTADFPLGTKVRLPWRILRQGFKAGGWAAVFYMIEGMMTIPVRQIPALFQDWVVGLGMRDYAWRHLQEFPEDKHHKIQEALASLSKVFSREVAEHRLYFARKGDVPKVSGLSVHLTNLLDNKNFKQMGKCLGKLLRRSPVNLTLHIESYKEEQSSYFKALLKRLSVYGDRVHIAFNKNLLCKIPVDSSVFHVVLS